MRLFVSKWRNWSKGRKDRIKRKLHREQNNVCGICKNNLVPKGFYFSECDLNIDHKVPIAAGGCDELWNLQLVYKRCNIHKAIEEWDIIKRTRAGAPIE